MLLKIIIVIACVILVYIIWQWQELKKFARTDYEIKSGKVQREYKAAVLADLHGFQYGKDNARLLDAKLFYLIFKSEKFLLILTFSYVGTGFMISVRIINRCNPAQLFQYL